MRNLGRVVFWSGVGLLAFNVASALLTDRIEVATSIMGALATFSGVCLGLLYVFSREDELT